MANTNKNPEYLNALEAWKDFADNLDENLEKVQLEQAEAERQKEEQKKKNDVQVEDLDHGKKGGKDNKDNSIEFDEANDNFNINSMLANIMDALKNEGKLKPPPKVEKKLYAPIEKVIKPDLELKPPVVYEAPKKDSKKVDDFSYEAGSHSKINSVVSNIDKTNANLTPGNANLISSKENLDEDKSDKDRKSPIQNLKQIVSSEKTGTTTALGNTLKVNEKANLVSEPTIKNPILVDDNKSKNTLPSIGETNHLIPQSYTKKGDEKGKDTEVSNTVINAGGNEKSGQIADPQQTDPKMKQNWVGFDFSQMDEVANKGDDKNSKPAKDQSVSQNNLKINTQTDKLLTPGLPSATAITPNDIAKSAVLPGKNESNKIEGNKADSMSSGKVIDNKNQKGTKKKDNAFNFETENAKAEQAASQKADNTASHNDSKEIQAKVVTIHSKDKPPINQTDTGKDSKDIKDAKDSKDSKDKGADKASIKDQDKTKKDGGKNKPGKIDTNIKKDIKDMILDASPILKKDEGDGSKSNRDDTSKKDKKDGLAKQSDKFNREDSDAVERRNLVDLMQMTRPISPNDQYIDSLSQYQLEIRSDEKFHPGSKVFPADKLDESDFDEYEEREKKIEDDVIQLSFDFEISRVQSESNDEDLEMERLMSQHSIQDVKILEEEKDAPVKNWLIRFYLWLLKKGKKIEEGYKRITSKGYTLDTFFERNCTFFKGKVKITKDGFFVFLLLTACMMYFLIDTSGTPSLTRVQKDAGRLFIAELLIPAALIFTYYGIAYLYIKWKWAKIISLLQIIPCLLVILIEFLILAIGNESSFSMKPVYICAFFVIMNTFWAITRYVREDVKKKYNWNYSMLFLTIWCILLPTAIISYAVYYIITPRRYDNQWQRNLVMHIGIPMILLLCCTWVYYHLKFFMPLAKKRPTLVPKKAAPVPEEKPQENEEDKYHVEETSEKGEEEPEQKPPLKVRVYVFVARIIKKISSSVIEVSSIVLGTFMIIMECILLGYLATVTETAKMQSIQAFYIAGFLFFFIPAFILFGIPVIAEGKDHRKKMLWIPLFAIFFPLFITMPLSFYLNGNSDTTSIGDYLLYAPSLGILFWITLYYIGMKRKRTKFGIVPFVFICFMIPLVILGPIIKNNGYQNSKVAQGFSIFFLVVGGIIIALALAYFISRALLVKEISLKDRLNTDNYRLIAIFKADLEAFGYWINSVGFIICFTISLYSVFHSPSEAPQSLKGMALGIAFVFMFFFVYSNYAMNLRTVPEVDDRKNRLITISEAINESAQNNELAEEIAAARKHDRKVKRVLRLLTVVVLAISVVLTISFINSTQFIKNMFASLAVGIIAVHIFFEVFAVLKLKKGSIVRAVVPMIVAYMWFVQLLELASLLHLVRIFFYRTPEDDGRRTRMEILLVVLVFVITVSLLAIIANIIFKGIELSQKIRYILAYLKKKMEEIAVKSDFYVLEKVFDGWMNDGEKKLKSSLLNRGRPVFWWPIAATNPIEKYSKQLLDFDAYKNLKNKAKKRKEGEPPKEDKPLKKHNCLPDCCINCFNYCFPEEEEVKKPGIDLQDEIDEMIDINLDDIPLPPKEDGEESESDDELDIGVELGDYEVERQIAMNRQKINDLKFEPLDPRIYRAMAYYDKGIKFSYHDKETVDFLKMVFRMFAVGSYKLFRKRWLDYLGYKKFLYLSGTIPSPQFPDYMIDLTYTLYTHNVGKGEIQRKINYSKKKNDVQKKNKKNKKEEEREDKTRLKIFPIFEEDFEGFLIHIAKIMYPNEVSDHEALFKYIRWHLFTNFVHLLDKFQKEYAHEYDYLLWLKKLYMGLGAAKGKEDDIDETIGQDGENVKLKDGDDPDGKNKKNKDGKIGSETDGLLNKNTMNELGADTESLLNVKKKPKYPCCRRIMITLCGGLVGCTKSLFKALVDLIKALFFLKTNAQKSAEEEFDNQQLKDEREEREELKKKRADKYNQENLGDDPDLLEEDLNKQGKFRRKAKTYPHAPSPDWPVIAQTLIQGLKDAENDYEHRRAGDKKSYFIPSIRNYLTLFALFFEIYAMAALSFRKEVPWGWNSTVQAVFAFPGGVFDDYYARFWFAFGFAVYYSYLGYFSIEFAKESLLGAEKLTFKAGEFPSRGFAHSQILIYTSTAISVWVIKSLLDVLSCDYRTDTWTLYSEQEIVCFVGFHRTLLGLAGLAMILYYPLSSFLYPNLQYLNKGNDFKHDSSFVVALNQIKLIIITLHVYFPFEDEVLISLAGSAALFICLALLCNALKPCVVLSLNLWETSAFFAGCWINLIGIVAYVTEDMILATILLLLGLLALLIVTIFLHKRKKYHDHASADNGNKKEEDDAGKDSRDISERKNLLDHQKADSMDLEEVLPPATPKVPENPLEDKAHPENKNEKKDEHEKNAA